MIEAVPRWWQRPNRTDSSPPSRSEPATTSGLTLSPRVFAEMDVIAVHDEDIPSDTESSKEPLVVRL